MILYIFIQLVGVFYSQRLVGTKEALYIPGMVLEWYSIVIVLSSDTDFMLIGIL